MGIVLNLYSILGKPKCSNPRLECHFITFMSTLLFLAYLRFCFHSRDYKSTSVFICFHMLEMGLVFEWWPCNLPLCWTYSLSLVQEVFHRFLGIVYVHNHVIYKQGHSYFFLSNLNSFYFLYLSYSM